ncbi:hypothetical protein WJX72_005256 [[Myrmecia] bisecta]|uniref:TOG domain-containing protein n=1 Tax=[Myrmecia] bisecta TaxID=41462 RepID=A0AAW1P1T0_9CHLO
MEVWERGSRGKQALGPLLDAVQQPGFLEANAEALADLDLPAAKKAAVKLLSCQAGYLERLLQSNVKQQAVSRVVHSVLKCKPALLPVYVEVAQETGSTGLQLRHNKESVRAPAAAVVQGLVSHVSNTTVVSSMFKTIKRALDGSAEGKLRNVYERAGLVAALSGLAAVPGAGQPLAELAVQVAEFICTLYKEEANDDVRLTLLSALALWLERADSFPLAAESRFILGMKEKDLLRKAHLRCLLQALRGRPGLRAQAAGCIAGLTSIIMDSLTKAVLRADGAMALLATAFIASASLAADTAVQKQGTWAAVLKPDSVLLASSTVAKFSAEDAASIADLPATLLLQQALHLEGSPGCTETLCRTQLLLLLHYSTPVRQAASRAVSACVPSSMSLSEALFQALYHWMQNPQELPLTSAAQPAEDGATASVVLLANRFCQALLALTPRSVQVLSVRGLARLMLAAHHPVVGGACAKPLGGWQAASRKLGNVQALLTPGEADTLVHLMFGPDGVGSHDSAQRKAAGRALGSVMAVSPDIMHQPISAALVKAVDRTEHDVLSPNEIKIYETPEGDIALERNIKTVFGAPADGGRSNGVKPAAASARAPAKQPQSNGVRSGSGGRGRGAGGKAAKDPAQELRLQQLAEESAVRQRVQKAMAVACALRLVELAHTGGDGGQAIAEREPVVDTVHALSAATAGGSSLADPTFAFCFPVLRAVLAADHHTGLHEDALAVLALHVARDRQLPRKDMLALLYHALGIVSAYRERIQPLLHELCAGLGPEQLWCALQGLLAAAPNVRAAALEALSSVPCLAQGACPHSLDVTSVLWLACHDPNQANALTSHQVWQTSECCLGSEFVSCLMGYLGHAHADVRSAAAAALAAGIKERPAAMSQALDVLTDSYSHGSVRAREGAALALKACANLLTATEVPRALDLLLGQGLADPDDGVREAMVQAGVALVDAHGKQHAQMMLPLFESYLEGAKKGGRDEARYDRVREGAVVFLGTLARHLDPKDPKVRAIIETLLEVLMTPSESVQRAVSSCLPALMGGLAPERSYVEGLLQRLLTRATKSDRYGDRRGAGFGLAGVVKGLGISAINGYGILPALKAAMADKDNPNSREGALLAFECLSEKLGRLFEPYVVTIMKDLLERFSDVSAPVREATEVVAREIMSNLSGQGVKIILPHLLAGVEDRAWRTKQGSIQMLGAMAFCAPKQLSTCLPTIVPVLSSVLSDPHPKVQQAARTGLDELGSIIRNPEVAKLVPTLLAAISDPNKYAKGTLDVLLNTTFVNTVDAASLALIVPVVHRGLRDRSGDAKKRAARIVGNMCALINEPKDMAPYVPLLMPELRAALIDPLPEVRATAAKALGSLLRGMGPHHFQDLTPWLLEMLKSEGSSVERSGAAQGLAEVLAVLGPAHLEALLPDILANTTARSAYVREGHLSLFKYLPLAIPEIFQTHLSTVLPAILDGLADEAEGVRDAALAAGRTFVELYAESALPLLLPAVEDGIVHANWRIRQSSVELLGDLLFKVAGTTGRVRLDGDDDDEGASTEAHGNAIIEALGQQRRNQVLARVYMARSDVGYTVRSASVHVWKTIVTNTPRTLGEILPTLMDQIIESLADPGEERQQMAGRCLGELVRKMGDRVLLQIVPILQAGMRSPDAPIRQGVCYGLKELLENISRYQLSEYLGQLLPTVQAALCDPDPGVRQAAGAAFSILFKGGPGGAVDSVIPSLLAGLEGGPGGAEQALEGLRVILGVRPQALATMLPKLLRPPLTSTSIRALGALAEVAGPSIHPHLHSIFPPLLVLAAQHDDIAPAVPAAKEALAKVSAGVAEDGVYLLVAELEKALEDPTRRKAAADIIALFCRTTKLDFQEHIPSLITALITLFMEEEADVLAACWFALVAVTAAIPKELQPSYVRSVKEAVATAREKERRKRKPAPLRLPGFCLPKALAPVLPIYLQGVLQGSSPELREVAAEGLGELVDVTSEEALRPFVVQITGPLIRIIGDRFPWQIKAAILHTLGLLIAKAGAGLKPFVPQLQTTFIKCLQDQARQVRQSAAANLGQLTKMSLRVDQLANDLVANARTAPPAIQEAYLTALRGLLAASGARLSSNVISATCSALQDLMAAAGEDESIRSGIASSLGLCARYCAIEQLQSLLAAGPLAPPAPAWPDRLGAALTLAALAQAAPGRLQEGGAVRSTVDTILRLSRDDSMPVKLAAGKATGLLVLAEVGGQVAGGSALAPLVPVLVALLGNDQASDVQRQGLQVLRLVAGADATALEPYYSSLVPSICSLLQETAGPTRLAAERTLACVLQIDRGLDAVQRFLASGTAGSLARSTLADTYVRRLSRLGPGDEDDQLTI